MAIPTATKLKPELVFTTARSSGPGGQNVNKVNSKVILNFNVNKSAILTDEEKSTILSRLKSRINQDGDLMVVAQESRSQSSNRDLALHKLNELLQKAFVKRKVRKATKPSKSAVKSRLESKKLQSEKKKLRQKPV